MTAIRLTTRRIDKPWGRDRLWPGFDDPAPGTPPIGEIWFEAPHDAPDALLVKYLFTSEKLSVQVHPDDARARATGHRSGKDEAWVILAAEPGATIALGTHRPVAADELRAAALDGSIETLLDWKPVAAGDVFYVPAGTVHAIGAGITVVEVQQNADVTYRLYDYGRPRELHLDAGIAAADARPYTPPPPPRPIGPGRTVIAEGEKFGIERLTGAQPPVTVSAGDAAWLIPISGTGSVGGLNWRAGECWLLTGAVTIDPGSDDADVLIAYPAETAGPDR